MEATIKAAVSLRRDLPGRILDIGGGGEGVIGRIFGTQVTAIDNRQDELDEAPGGFEKRLMDAADLCFADESFDSATAFFSLMYFSQDTVEKAVAEVFRVLKPGGIFCVWDADIRKADPFIIELDIDAAGIPIHTTYGVYHDEKFQNAKTIQAVCEKSGFQLLCVNTGDIFLLRFQKP